MLLERPYFMENKEWYWSKPGKTGYMLTDKAPEKAKQSYKEFYEELKNSYNYSKVFVMTDEEIEAGIQEYKKLVAEGKLPPQDD